MMMLLLFLLVLSVSNSEVVRYKAKSLHHRTRVTVLGDHTAVSDARAFPYMAAILYRDAYVSAATLISQAWLVTAADGLYLMRETTRLLRVRLGSTNYKKGGSLLAVQKLEIHPYFDDIKPTFDVALVKLSHAVNNTRTLNPIRIYKDLDVKATHFVVTAWSAHSPGQESPVTVYGEDRRSLFMSHLHKTDADTCTDTLESIGVNSSAPLLCFEPTVKTDPCERDAGAAVVYKGELLGVMSSWRSSACSQRSRPVLVTPIAAADVAGWVRSVIRTPPRPWTILIPQKNTYIADNNSTERLHNYAQS